MPGGDRTGPMGQGPMTGRAAGYCTGNPVPGYTNPVAGRGAVGFGRGGGFGGGGRGYRNRFYATGLTGWQRAAGGAPAYAAGAFPPAPQSTGGDEIEMLKAQAQNIQGTLENINKRIEELEAAR
ncbi:MAG: DUF5320 domain-containing protein [Gemmatimonadota bacterium]|nr:DUF5320 domain-containing protein [Gemmatimonadota bacterium]